MKELQGSASAVVAASPEQCLELLRAVDRYPTWYPEVVRAAEVLERDSEGRPTRTRTTLHLSRGPLEKDFQLLMEIVTDPSGVRLTRVAQGPGDEEQFEATWRVELKNGTRIHLRLDANLSVPRLLPLGGVGDALADGFVTAAARALA
jgi:ribosome-associated toxin RatA of RatAB toxin-antitoxin module